jgi:Tol biopolymer transport system component
MASYSTRMARRGIVTCAALFACLCAPAQAQLVYSADGRLYEIDADGSDRSLFAPPTTLRSSDSEPEWSPDGTQVAVVREHAHGDPANWSRIDLLSRDGATRRRLTPVDHNVFVSSPTWSPDGDQLAFARATRQGDHFTSSIVVTDLDGNERTVVSQRLDRRLSSVGAPEWSPDGAAVLYSAFELDRRSYFKSSIRIAPVDGGSTELFVRDASWPVFSPDGARIAFVSIADRNGEACGSDECSYNGELYVMDADGENARRLTRNKGDDIAPAWAPDGSRIAFNSNRNYPRGPSHEVYSIEPDGDCLTWLTNGTASSVTPAWRPSTADTHPGGCGATRRPPLLETDLAPVRAFAAARPVWLGRVWRGLLLSHVERGAGLFLGYHDCARYMPSDCPGTVEVSVTSICARFTQVRHLRGRAERRRRALVQPFNRFDLRALTGGLDVQVIAVRPLRVFRALRPFPREAAVEDLRPATIPAWLARQVRRAVRLHERLGSITAVSKRMELSRRIVRERLATAKTLDDFGHRVRTKRCPRPFHY